MNEDILKNIELMYQEIHNTDLPTKGDNSLYCWN